MQLHRSTDNARRGSVHRSTRQAVSRSAESGKMLTSTAGISDFRLQAPHAENMGRLHAGMQGDIVVLAVPDVAIVSQEVIHLVAVATQLTEFFDRRFDPPALRVERIKVNDDKDDTVPARSHLTVEKQRLV